MEACRCTTGSKHHDTLQHRLQFYVRLRTRIVALGLLVALSIAACGAAGIDGSNPLDNVELTETNNRTDPFSESGGAISSTDGVIVDEAGAALLGAQVRSAVRAWPTDFTRRTVDFSEFLLGLPRNDPRDGIPPIDNPKFQPIETATWLGEREPGALVHFNGESRFYPLSIMTRHEIVNDRFGDVPVAVTFCPLCNSVVAFDARVDGNALRFGVSGLLRNSDLVMWDDATTSLWQQLTGEGIVGEFAGTQLEIIPASIVSYASARENFPEALSLSTDTGFGINYGANSYAGYSSSGRPFLYNGPSDDRYPALSRVVGITIDGQSKAYPFEVIAGELAVNDEIADAPVVVFWGGDTADALDARSIADSQAIGTAIALSRTVEGQVLTFSSAGNDTFTDAETGSTWSLIGVSTAGQLAGSQLDTVQHRNEFWFAWAAFFGEAPVYTGT